MKKITAAFADNFWYDFVSIRYAMLTKDHETQWYIYITKNTVSNQKQSAISCSASGTHIELL